MLRKSALIPLGALTLGVFAACSGRQTQPVPSVVPQTRNAMSTAASPAPTPFAYTWRTAGQGKINGLDNSFRTSNNDADNKPASGQYDGDLMPADPGAKPGGGGQGPTGNKVDNISCDPTMSNNYHIHAFVGIYATGKELALPDAVGIVRAAGDQYDKYSGWSNEEIYGECFYHVHVHDASGLVHMEDPNPTHAPITKSLFTLGNLFDIWGVKVNSTQFGPYHGTVTVYTSGNSATVPCSTVVSCEIGASQYKLWTSDPHTMPLYSHEAIWIEIGTGNPNSAHLPGVYFALRQ